MRAGAGNRLGSRGRFVGVAVIGALGLAVLVAPSAFAATGGGTASGGSMIGHDPPFIGPNGRCVKINSLDFSETTSTASYTPISGVTYIGPATLTLHMIHGPGYAGPTGTFGYNTTCNFAPGAPYDVTGTVTGTNGSGDTVSCTYNSGSFSRVNPSGGKGTDTAVASLNGTCDITVAPFGTYYGSPTNEVRDLAYTGCDTLPPNTCTDNDVFTVSDPGNLNSLSVTSPSTLPGATNNVLYTTELDATGGIAPYHWRADSRAYLPPGLKLSDGGVLAGTPTTPGTYSFNVIVQDSASPANSYVQYVTIRVT